jgi:tetratricopeptide (TPR) repeat protein
MADRQGDRPARTVLEQKIRERRQTLEEFVDYVETFRREHNQTGTLGLRHLERLVSGHRGDGKPLGPVRPATARLLERIFNMSVGELLSPPRQPDREAEIELRQRLSVSRQIDSTVIGLLCDQVNALRRLDRQLGALVAYDEVTTKAAQISSLQSHSLSPAVRASLAALLAELSALAGWEALDRFAVGRAWEHHEQAKVAAREADSPILFAHALAQQAVILIDSDEPHAAVAQVAEARNIVRCSVPPIFQSWLAAAHGEALAAAGKRSDALRAFDMADTLLPSDPFDPELPFLFLGGPHLDRWRGHALAQLGDRDAISVLSDALNRLDPSFIRAETALRVDLATTLLATGEREEAKAHATVAARLASDIGSARQARRVRVLSSLLGSPSRKPKA